MPGAPHHSSEPPRSGWTIDTTRLRLRRVTLADACAIASYRSDPLVARLQSWEDYTLADAEALCRGQEGTVFGAPGSWAQLAIVRRADGELIGDLGIHFCEGPERTLEVGITLSRRWQGRGLASEALAGVLDLAFGEFGAERVRACVDEENGPAGALLRRLGFVRDPARDARAPFKGGWAVEHTYWIGRGDWGEHPLAGAAKLGRMN